MRKYCEGLGAIYDTFVEDSGNEYYQVLLINEKDLNNSPILVFSDTGSELEIVINFCPMCGEGLQVE